MCKFKDIENRELYMRPENLQNRDLELYHTVTMFK